MAIPHLFMAGFTILAYPLRAIAAVSALSCPQDIESAGETPGNWTLYNNWNEFLGCNEKPRLFKLSNPNDHDDQGSQSEGAASGIQAVVSLRGEIMPTIQIPWAQILANTDRHVVDVQVSWSEVSDDAVPGQAVTALFEMSAYFSVNALELDENNPTTLFAQYGDTTVGVYIGERINAPGAAYTVLQQAIRRIKKQGISRSFTLQYCGLEEPQASIGVFVGTSGDESDLAAAQQAAASWGRDGCIPGFEHSDIIMDIDVWMAPYEGSNPQTNSPSTSLATVTRITSSVLPSTSFTYPGSNPSHSSTVTTALRRRAPPERNSDGSCGSYPVGKGENCDSIARAHDLKVNDILEFNQNKTWGFKDCGPTMPYDILICLSEGDPPLPPPVDGLECGPRVPGTQKPSDGTALSDLNPCPLNVCCSQHGFCGLTPEFCEVTGKVAGISGCISNCETGITNNKQAPAQYISIGYFEAWNGNRPCLHMDADDIDTSRFTHIHFAFGQVTPQWGVDISGGTEEQFQKFVKLQGVKRIVSFGGWADSTEIDKFWIFRKAVETTESRLALAQNLVSFVKEYDLDGIDIDWEYPAAPDIPDIPKGDPIEGENYLSLIALLRVLLPTGKTLSIASPASYWYLKGIPIEAMSEYLDYIVYMTYDLHGQWDTESEWSQPGCAYGNCLRSHVNYTETIDALSMITRAGVPAHKVIVGVASYGRSFKMAEKGCTGPMCTYLGGKKDSQAKKGPCTGEPGYISNAEIDMIIDTNLNVEKWYDGKTMTNYLVYDDVEWVAYMNSSTKATRTTLYRILNFGGVTDWAVDLEGFGNNEYMTPGAFSLYATEGSCTWTFADGLSCTDPAVKDLANTDKGVRWKQLHSICAWNNLTAAWSKSGTSMKFPEFASAHFRGPISEPGDSGPGAQPILEAFVLLNEIFEDLYNALDIAFNSVESVTENFVKVFGQPPEQKDLQRFNIVLDILGMGLSMVMAPVFNNVMKLGPKVKDDVKDSVYGLTSWGLSLAKDVQDADDVEEAVELQIRADLKHLFLGWKEAVKTINIEIFSGNDKSNHQLFELFDNGTLSVGEPSDGYDAKRELLMKDALQKQVEKVAYAQMIPRAWNLAGWRPVVVDGGKCDDVGAVVDYIGSGTGEKTDFCYKDRRYYLVAAPRPWVEGTSDCHFESPPVSGSNPPCWDNGDDPRFEQLPGNDKLEKGDDFSVDTWKDNGNKNGHKKLNYEDQSQADKLINDDDVPVNVRAPGVFRIPVCSAKDAYERWTKEGKKWPSADDMPEAFPCP